MDQTLLGTVILEMACPQCGSRVVTHERLARESGVSLRTAVRFLQGKSVSGKTAAAMSSWLNARVLERAAAIAAIEAAEPD